LFPFWRYGFERRLVAAGMLIVRLVLDHRDAVYAAEFSSAASKPLTTAAITRSCALLRKK
jgi:hypothetical protein